MDQPSPLRSARVARNLTQEQVVEALDRLADGGSSGITPSMLSGWERGRHRTTFRHRELLCRLFERPAEVLFAHQDEILSSRGETPRLLAGYHDLSGALVGVVSRAEKQLVVTGSRSRDADYLTAIESALDRHPQLVHYRVLFGPPHHAILRDHLLRLLDLRDPEDRTQGFKTLHIGIVDDTQRSPERFVCASETEAVHPIASLTTAEAFDSGVMLGPRAAERLVDHVRGCYAASRRLETRDDVLQVPVLRTREA